MTNAWHQQAFALDAKYNAQRATKLPTLGMLYIRRRNQLLREKSTKECKLRDRYLRLRSKLLHLRYGEQNSFIEEDLKQETIQEVFEAQDKAKRFQNVLQEKIQGMVQQRNEIDTREATQGKLQGMGHETSPKSGKYSTQSSRLHQGDANVTTERSTFLQSDLKSMTESTRTIEDHVRSATQASKSLQSHQKSTAEGFAFAGVHNVFEQKNNCTVTMLKFANNDKGKLCYSSMDGTLEVCQVDCVPVKVIATLKGHKDGVTSLDWSTSNDLVVSGSLDGTVRLWSLDESIAFGGKCLRVIFDPQKAKVLCCAFTPVNNNLVVTGNSDGVIRILNISTGIYTKGGSCKIGGSVLSLICQLSGGSTIWAANDRGNICSYHLHPSTGRLSKLQRVLELPERITNLSWRSWLCKECPGPALLISSPCNSVLVYTVADAQGGLVLWRKYPIRHRLHPVKATFSPQLGASLIATGGDDGSVLLIDATKEGKYAMINNLHGHAAPTLSLAFNYDESLLVSADQQGLIIVWRNGQRCA